MVSVTKILHFNNKKKWQKIYGQYFGNSMTSGEGYHTLLGHGRQVETSIWMEQEPFQRDNWLGCCKVFLSYRTPKIPSSLNRPVSKGSKIVGKTEREKNGKCSNHD